MSLVSVLNLTWSSELSSLGVLVEPIKCLTLCFAEPGTCCVVQAASSVHLAVLASPALACYPQLQQGL